MSARDRVEEGGVPSPESEASAALHAMLASRPVPAETMPGASVVVGELIGIVDEGRIALVMYPGQSGSAALRARSVVDLRGEQIGSSAVLMFEGGSSMQPIVMGLLRAESPTAFDAPGHVEVSVDGTRMTVSAKDRLDLRCGEASITLTRAGKIFIEGSYILNKSSGVNRITGGSVQIN
jgi:hypothetical protein